MTRERLLSAARPRFEFVEVAGFGRVGIRSVPRSLQSVRQASMYDQATGELLAEEAAKADTYALIDQLMISESEPMFTEDDLEVLQQADAATLAPLILAVGEFNARGIPPGK